MNQLLNQPGEYAPAQKLTPVTVWQDPKFQEAALAVGGRGYDIDKFKGIGRMMAINNPDIQNCDLKSLTKAVLNCAKFQLYPDGHYAHILTRNQKGSTYKQAQLIIDYKGLLELLRRNGVTAEAKLVCENDDIEVTEDDGKGRTKIVHRINYKQPRGEVIFVYSRAVFQRDEERVISYDIMTLDEINAIRSRSPAGRSGPWVTDFNEMAKKTVIRRHSKILPLDSTTLVNLQMDDDRPQDIQQVNIAASPEFTERPEIALPEEKPVEQDPDPESEDSNPELETQKPPEQPKEKSPQPLSWATWSKNYGNLGFVQKNDLYLSEANQGFLRNCHENGLTPAKAAKAWLEQQEEESPATQEQEQPPETTQEEEKPAQPDGNAKFEELCAAAELNPKQVLRFCEISDSADAGMEVVYNSFSSMNSENQERLLNTLNDTPESFIEKVKATQI